MALINSDGVTETTALNSPNINQFEQEKEAEETLEITSVVAIAVGCILAVSVLAIVGGMIARRSKLFYKLTCAMKRNTSEEKQQCNKSRKTYDAIGHDSEHGDSKISLSCSLYDASSVSQLVPTKTQKEAKHESDNGNNSLTVTGTNHSMGQRSPAITRSLRHGRIPFTLPPMGLSKSFSQDSASIEQVQPPIQMSSTFPDSSNPTDNLGFIASDDSTSSNNRNSSDGQACSYDENPTASPELKIQSPSQFRHSLLGQIQPELYKYTENEDHDLPPSQYGRVWFSLVYDAAVEALTVTVIKIRQLPGRRSNVPHDSFIKLFLLPDERMSQQTKVQRRTNNPRFNETFVFQVSESDIRERTLRLSAYDVDKRKVARHLLGHALVTLSDVDLLSQGENVMWRDLDDRAHPGDSGASLGEINISLSYLPSMNRLTAVVLRARNLREIDLEATGVYVKVSLTQGHQVIKTRKTAVKRGVCDPSYNESFSFTVSAKDMESSCLSINVITLGYHSGLRQITSSLKNIVSTGKPTNQHKYGRVVVGSFMFCRGEQLFHWQEMLAQPRKSIVRWHPLSDVTTEE